VLKVCTSTRGRVVGRYTWSCVMAIKTYLLVLRHQVVSLNSTFLMGGGCALSPNAFHFYFLICTSLICNRIFIISFSY